MFYLGAIFSINLLACYPASFAAAEPEALRLRVADQSKGVLTLAFNPHNHSLRVVDQVDAGFHPNWIFPFDDKVFTISRAVTAESKRAGLYAFEGFALSSLSLIDKAVSNGLGGVYVGVNRDGKTLAAADMYDPFSDIARMIAYH